MDTSATLLIAVFAGACVASLLAIAGSTLRDRRTPGGMLGRWLRGDLLPEVAFLFLAALLLSSLGSAAFGAMGLPEALVVVLGQVLGFIAPTLLLARVLPGEGIRERLSLRTAPWEAVVGGGLLGLGMWIPMWIYLAAQELIFPVPPEDAEALADLIGADSILGLVGVVLAFALTPALCEELLVRGGMMGLARRTLGGRGAIVLTALLFGILHLQPFRIVPTALLGLALGYVAWRFGSLLPNIALHLVHNSELIVFAFIAPETEEAPPELLAIGVLGLLLGAYLIREAPPSPLVPWAPEPLPEAIPLPVAVEAEGEPEPEGELPDPRPDLPLF